MKKGKRKRVKKKEKSKAKKTKSKPKRKTKSRSSSTSSTKVNAREARKSKITEKPEVTFKSRPSTHTGRLSSRRKLTNRSDPLKTSTRRSTSTPRQSTTANKYRSTRVTRFDDDVFETPKYKKSSKKISLFESFANRIKKALTRKSNKNRKTRKDSSKNTYFCLG